MSTTIEPLRSRAQTATGCSRETDRPLRIVHTISSLQVGGMEQFVLRIAASQAAQGHGAVIVALRGGPLAAEAARLHVPVRVLSGSHKATRLARGLAVMARLRPDIVHAHNPTSLHYATLGKLVCGARVLMTDHGQGLGSVRRPSRREWSRTDAVVAVSNAVARRRESEAMPVRRLVIPNGVQIGASGRAREEVRAAWAVPPDQVLVITVARIDGLKGHDTLLSALAELRRGAYGVARFTQWVVGDGAQRPAIEAMARELGLEADSVRFLGFRSDVPDLLGAADLFILPSLTEGLPLSILEAMTHQLPVIATPVGGVPEVVLPGLTGLLVPTEDPGALASAMAELIRDVDRRAAFGRAGYQRVLAEFSFERMVERYEALYRELRGNEGRVTA